MARKTNDGGGAKAPWMPFYGRDFYSDVFVRAMTWEQRGIYQFLLWTAWDEGAIPGDAKMLAAICGMQPRQFAKVWQDVLRDRWVAHPSRAGWLINRRQERVRQSSGELSERMRALAEKRWANEEAARSAAESDAECMRDACDDAPSADADTHTNPHAQQDCETACDPPCDAAVLTTTTTKTTVTANVDGSMDGGSRTGDRDGVAVRRGSTRDAGAIAAEIAAGVTR